MPMYDYACDKCEKITQHIHSVKDCDVEIKCHECESVLRRAIGRPNFHLKGHSWFANGYQRAKPLSWLKSDEYRKQSGAYEEEKAGNFNHGYNIDVG